MSDPGQDAGDARRVLRAPGGRLACGASVDDLLEQVAAGRSGDYSGHQGDCPHCQAALRALAALWEPVRRRADEPVSVPAGLKAAITAQVRRLTADIWYTLQITDGGAIRVAARVVASVARDAARAVPGVRVAFGRSTRARLARLVEKATLGHRHPHAAIGVLGRTAVVDLAIAAEYGGDLDAVARQVQQKVIADLRAGIGLRDITVNVTVDDILTDGQDE